MAALVCVALLGALAVAVHGPAYEVRGNAQVPYDAGTVKKVRVLDSFTVYVDGEPKPGFTVLGGIALIALATAAFMTALALRLAASRRKLVAFYSVAAAGLCFLGLDELFAIHESIGHNLRFLADVPGVSRPDDLVIALYAIPAFAFIYLFRDVLLSVRHAALAFAAGLAFFAISSFGDITSRKVIEEYFELFSGLCIAAGFAQLMYTHLHRNLRFEPAVVDEVTVVDQRAQHRVPVETAAKSR